MQFPNQDFKVSGFGFFKATSDSPEVHRIRGLPSDNEITMHLNYL